MNDFNIQAASLFSGVSVHNIRAWERRYNAVIPKRLYNNFRSYSQDDLARLKLLGILTKLGISISKISALKNHELREQIELLGHNEKFLQNEESTKETEEALNLLLVFLSNKKTDILKHELSKFQTCNSIIEILIPIGKKVNLQSSFNEEDKQSIFEVLFEQINKIITKENHNIIC
jgi:DNA-binding transcriptional MerR regulator